MRSFSLATPLVFTCVLSAAIIDEVVRDSRSHIEGIGGTLSVETRNGIHRVIINFPISNGTLTANYDHGLIIIDHSVRIAETDENAPHIGEVIETSISLPFTPLHSFVQQRPLRDTVTTKLTLIEGNNPKLAVALQREPNMKIYLHGAHARTQVNGAKQMISIAPRNVLYNIVLAKADDTPQSSISLEIQERGSGRVLESWVHRKPGNLHRQLTELLTLAKLHKARELAHVA